MPSPTLPTKKHGAGFAQAVIWLTAAEIIYNLSGYVVHALTGRFLGPAEYGRYGLTITLTTMLIVLVGNGIPTAMSKYLSGVSEKDPGAIYGIRRSAFFLQLILMGSLTVLFYLAAPLLAWILRDPSLTPLFQLSSLVIPTFAAASFNLYFFVGLHFFRVQAALKTLRSLARILFIGGLALSSGTWGAVTGNILAPLTVFLVGLALEPWLMRRYFPQAVAAKQSGPAFPWRTILRTAWPLTLFLFCYELILTLDLFLVKILLANDHLTGLYNAAVTVGRIPYYLFYALALALLPTIAKSEAHRDTEATKKLLLQSFRLMLFFLVPVVVLLARYASETLHLFYGDAYAAAAAPMSILVWGIGALTVFYVFTFALNGAGLLRYPLLLAVVGVVLGLGLNLVLIPLYDLVGAAWAVTATSVLLMLGILAKVMTHFAIVFPWRSVAMATLAAIHIAVFSRFLPAGPWFLLSSTLLGLFYLGFLYLTKVLTKEDLTPLTRLLKLSA